MRILLYTVADPELCRLNQRDFVTEVLSGGFVLLKIRGVLSGRFCPRGLSYTPLEHQIQSPEF